MRMFNVRPRKLYVKRVAFEKLKCILNASAFDCQSDSNSFNASCCKLLLFKRSAPYWFV